MSFFKDVAVQRKGLWIFIPLLGLYVFSYFQRSAVPGQIFTQLGSLAVVEVGKPGLITLEFVGKGQNFCLIGGFQGEVQAVAFLELLLTGHSQALGSDLLDVTFPGNEHGDGIIGNLFLKRSIINFG